MDISKDLFLTDGRSPYCALTLASRDLESHRLLTGLRSDTRATVNTLLAEAAAALAEILRAAHDAQERPVDGP